MSMMRFIYVCMAFLVISFIGVPVYNGISKEHRNLVSVADSTATEDDSLSFKEIYALADEGQSDDPASLNNIMPAAGGDDGAQDSFSTSFTNREDSALADTPESAPDTEPSIINTDS